MVDIDKNGQLSIWDAQAPTEEVDDDDEVPAENAEGGRYWQLQPHWPATAKSSISSIKFDPKDAHTVRRRISIPMQSLKPAS